MKSLSIMLALGPCQGRKDEPLALSQFSMRGIKDKAKSKIFIEQVLVCVGLDQLIDHDDEAPFIHFLAGAPGICSCEKTVCMKRHSDRITSE